MKIPKMGEGSPPYLRPITLNNPWSILKKKPGTAILLLCVLVLWTPMTRIKRNSITKSQIKNENSFEIGAFLENFRAIKQSSSQHTKKMVHSTKPRKNEMPVPFFFSR